jgi:hypothetical protein
MSVDALGHLHGCMPVDAKPESTSYKELEHDEIIDTSRTIIGHIEFLAQCSTHSYL